MFLITFLMYFVQTLDKSTYQQVQVDHWNAFGVPLVFDQQSKTPFFFTKIS